jgi:hypothetical protein
MARRVLNVGGGGSRDLPTLYREWRQDLLDIDPIVKPDICCDAKDLKTLPRGTYDAVFCSHNLEHFYHHEVPIVLAGMRHVLKRNGFLHCAVPDVAALMEAVVQGKKDIMDIWYTVPAGPIRFHDVLYGWSKEVMRGNQYYCHRTNFTEKSFTHVLSLAHFTQIYTARDGYNLTAFAFLQLPSAAQRKECGL